MKNKKKYSKTINLNKHVHAKLKKHSKAINLHMVQIVDRLLENYLDTV